MSTIENASLLGINQQFSIEAEARNLFRSEKMVMDNILNFFAEFACQVPLVSYHYLQKGNRLILPNQEHEIDLLEMVYNGVRPGSQRAEQEYRGFLALKNKIIEAKKPSFAVWISPPGPKDEGYGDYGFLYLALVPQHKEGQDRRITMLALRVNNFDDDTILKSTSLLLNLAPETPLPQNATTKDLLLNPIIFPVGKNCQINSIQDLLSQVSSFLETRIGQNEIEDGLSGRIFNQIREKFKSEIYEIFTTIWSLAKGIPIEINAEKLFASLPIDNFIGGSCPSKSETQIQNSESDDTKDQETHWCPECGQLFQGNQCGCGYQLN